MEPTLTKERQTTRFINENPTELVLTRMTKTDDGAGGYLSEPRDLEPQVVRVVQQRQPSNVERRNADGEVVRPTITLVCHPNTDVQRNDTFTWQGLLAEIVWVTDLVYVLHAEVAI